MKSHSHGYVYIAEIVDHPNMCKIGYSRSYPDKRVSQLKNKYKEFNFNLFNFIECDAPRRVENMCHEHFQLKKHYSEIFNVSPSVAFKFLINLKGKWYKTITTDCMQGVNCYGDEMYQAAIDNPNKFVRRCNKWFMVNNVRNITASDMDLYDALVNYVLEGF